MRRISKKTIISTSVIAFCVILCIPKIAYASGFTDVVCDMISGVITFFGDSIVFLCDSLGGKFDKLIFNYDGSDFNSDLNLMILKSGDISEKILSMYGVMQYIGSLVLITISLWITFDFVKASDNPQHKAVLSGRLKNMVLAIFLLNSIPTIVDVMLALNYAITDTFRMIAGTFAPESMDYSKSFLTETFKGLIDEKTGSEALILSVVYLVAAFVNVWLIIFYMIRDLAISFLLIMAPIMVCVLPFRTDLLVSWFKEMFSNIFTQAIQALIFTILIAIVAGITEDSDLYAQIFALVAFAMFIPMTGMIKKLLGLEGVVGAANSRAGLGAAVMAVALAGKTINGVKNQAGVLKSGHDRINDLKTERDNLGKHPAQSTTLRNHNNNNMNRGNSDYLSGSIAGMAAMGDVGGGMNELGMGVAMASMYGGGNKNPNFNPINTRNFPRDRNTIQGEINAIRKQTAMSLGSGIFSAIGGGAMAIGASGLGPMGAFAGLEVGTSLGSTAGVGVATGLAGIGSALSEKGQDVLYGKGIRPELTSITNGNKSWSPTNIMHNMSNMKKNMSDNISAARADMKYSPINTRFIPHEEKDLENLLIDKQARQDEMTGLTGDPLRDTQFYADEKDSIIQTQKYVRQGDFAKASRYRMQTSAPRYNPEAIKNLEQNSLNNVPTDNAMLYTDQNSSILFTQNNETGQREILASYPGNPHLSTPTMESVSFDVDGNIPVSDMQRSEFKEQAVNLAINKYGADSVSNSNNEYFGDAQQFIDRETNNLINQHVARNETLRHNTGSGNIVITGTVNHENVAGYNSVPNAVQDIHIDIPSNLQSQHSQDVYSNIEMSNVNISNKVASFYDKQVELMQQQQYTESLKQGANEINYNSIYNNISFDSQFN